MDLAIAGSAAGGDVAATTSFSRDGLVALKGASNRLCETLQEEIHKVEEALQSEYQKVEEAFGKLETESALRSEQAAAEETRVTRLHQLECAKIEEARAGLNAEKKAMQQVERLLTSRIRLNVGGKRIETSRGTLCSVEDSMLAAMFSGRHTLTPDEDGSYFIDRDGKLSPHYQLSA